MVTGGALAPATYISAALPTHGCDWCVPIPLREGHSQLHLMDNSKHELYIDIEGQLYKGSLHIILYVQYTLIDITELNIKITPDKYTHYPMMIDTERTQHGAYPIVKVFFVVTS